jgi:hypothetical protein
LERDVMRGLMVDKITTVARTRVGKRSGHLDDKDIVRLNRAIVVFLELGGAPRILISFRMALSRAAQLNAGSYGDLGPADKVQMARRSARSVAAFAPIRVGCWKVNARR